MPFPPMPPPPATPVKPHTLVGVLTDRHGNNITTGTPVIAVNETHAGSKRVVTRSGGEILINLANMSAWTVDDKIRVQVIDTKGNGEVFYVSPASGTGSTSISKVIRAINPVCGKRIDRFTGRSVVKA